MAKGKKGRKIGRWGRKPSHKRYVSEKRWIKNKARKLARMIRRHPDTMKIPDNLSDEVRTWVLFYLGKIKITESERVK